jgi:hypothetical protein
MSVSIILDIEDEETSFRTSFRKSSIPGKEHAMNETVNVLVPVGMLGTGVREDEVRRGVELGAHVIAADAGSTDSGAAYLALGQSKNSREAVKRDLEILMAAGPKPAFRC